MTKYIGIGLSGKMRSGKDTTAQALNAVDSRFVRVGFADELKRMAQKEISLDFFDEANKVKHRSFLINLGQAYRSYDPDFWVKRLLGNLPMGRFPVITDCRFQNEAKALKAAGFLLIRLEPSKDTILARGGKLLDDPSETDLDNYTGFDGYIDTDLNSPAIVAQKLSVAFGAPPPEKMFGQKFRVGDRVKVIGGLQMASHPLGTVIDVQRNPQRMEKLPENPVLTVRMDKTIFGRAQFELRPNQVEYA